jgi:outer membrane translocation and assembly module TamA
MRNASVASFLLLLATVIPAQTRDDSSVRIRKLTLTGETGLSALEIGELSSKLRSRQYTDDYANEIAEQTRYALQDHGYFKSIVYDPNLKVLKNLSSEKIVDVIVPVESGRMYRLGTIAFQGQTVFPDNELRAQFHVLTGSVFNRTAIGQGLENLRALYCHKGYVNFTSVPDTAVNEAKGTVSLLISIDEGGAYHYGELTVSGEESVPGAKQRLLEGWKPYEGKLYDCTGSVLTAYFRDLHLRPNLQPYEFVEASHDDKAHLVNLLIRVARPPFPIQRSPAQQTAQH